MFKIGERVRICKGAKVYRDRTGTILACKYTNDRGYTVKVDGTNSTVWFTEPELEYENLPQELLRKFRPGASVCFKRTNNVFLRHRVGIIASVRLIQYCKYITEIRYTCQDTEDHYYQDLITPELIKFKEMTVNGKTYIRLFFLGRPDKLFIDV